MRLRSGLVNRFANPPHHTELPQDTVSEQSGEISFPVPRWSDNTNYKIGLAFFFDYMMFIDGLIQSRLVRDLDLLNLARIGPASQFLFGQVDDRIGFKGPYYDQYRFQRTIVGLVKVFQIPGLDGLNGFCVSISGVLIGMVLKNNLIKLKRSHLASVLSSQVQPGKKLGADAFDIFSRDTL